MLLKVQSGRKGTVHEEEYLLKSVSKLVARFNQSLGETHCLLVVVSVLITILRKDETRSLIPHLLRFTAEHRTEAKALQESVRRFGEELGQAINEIWQQPPEEQPAMGGGPVSPDSRIVAPATVDRPVVGELEQMLCLTSKITTRSTADT
jgi:elongator complex protein 1